MTVFVQPRDVGGAVSVEDGGGDRGRAGFDAAMIGLDDRLGGDLRQHKAALAAPSGDPEQRRLAAGAVERAAQNLAAEFQMRFPWLRRPP